MVSIKKFYFKAAISILCLILLLLLLCSCQNNTSPTQNNNANMTDDLRIDVEDYSETDDVAPATKVIRKEEQIDYSQSGQRHDCAGWFSVIIPENMFFSDDKQLIMSTLPDNTESISITLLDYSDSAIPIKGFEEAVAEEEGDIRDFTAVADSPSNTNNEIRRESLNIAGRNWTVVSASSGVEDTLEKETVFLSEYDSDGYIRIEANYDSNSPILRNLLESFVILDGDPRENQVADMIATRQKKAESRVKDAPEPITFNETSEGN